MSDKRDFLTLEEFSSEEIMELVADAGKLKKALAVGEQPRILEGKSFVLLFEKPSTRTRISFEVGICQLGANAIAVGAGETQLGRGETIEDTARVLSRYADGLIVRTGADEGLDVMAAAAAVPVVNALSDKHHPCQALSDLFTIKEAKGGFDGLKLAYLGDGNNVCHSLLIASAKTGMDMAVATPPKYRPAPEIVARATALAADTGAVLQVVEDPREAASGADIIYTDVWVSMGDEDEETERLKTLAPYQVNGDILGAAKGDCLVMHCLPAHRGQEITEEVLEGARSVVFDQAENRLHAQKALLVKLVNR